VPTRARPGSGDLCLQAGAGAATGGSSPSLGSAFRDDRDRCRLWRSQFLASLGQARAALHGLIHTWDMATTPAKLGHLIRNS
jgi:hypothetical protein